MKSKKHNKKDCANTPFYASERGITLVALAVTIIVLVILTGITIGASIKDEGVIQQAQDSSLKDQIAKLEEKIELWRGNNDLANFTEENLETPKAFIERLIREEIITRDNVDGITITLGTYTINLEEVNTYNKVVMNQYIIAYVDGVPIPVGFETVEKSPGVYYKKNEGIVIKNIEDGNEFVWVPVDEVLESGSISYTDNKVTLISYESDKSDEPQSETGIPTGVADEYEAMKKSVKLYGGFYVGRYETNSSYGSISGVMPLQRQNWYTMYQGQKELYNEESDSVVSGMIYGSQWDAIMDWMSDVTNPNTGRKYIDSSIGMGVYDIDKGPLETGQYEVKNVFDLAGNSYEFTQEMSNSTERVVRGGWYNIKSNIKCAGQEASFEPIVQYGSVSSRLQLYIKVP